MNAHDRASALIWRPEKWRVYIAITMIATALAALSNDDLLTEVRRLAARESEATADLIASLAELDARRLYLDQGCSSLFTYCTQVLHLSEHAAYHRIEAARAARRFPLVLERLTRGEVTLTAVGLLAPHLTLENHGQLLDAARYKSKRDVELIVAGLRPQQDIRTSIRKLPAPTLSASAGAMWSADERAAAGGAVAAAHESAPCDGLARSDRTENRDGLVRSACPEPNRPAVVTPLTPSRYQLHVTLSAETHARLRRAQDLLRHAIPNGDVAAVLDRALIVLIVDLERKKLAATTRPRRTNPGDHRRPRVRSTRHIPAAVKRAVWARDGGRCAFVGDAGRCRETGRLEFHHVVPYADGGQASVESISLRCRAHNGLEAERWFGSGARTRSGPS